MADYLYKYRSLEGAGRRYAERLLIHNEVYFASPSTFNDPFDSRARISVGGTDEQHRANLLRLFREKRPELSEEARSAKVDEIIASGRHRDPSVYEDTTTNTQAQVDALGVFCLAGNPDSILMWAHYTAGHSGFCVQFLHRDEPFLGRAQDVRYSATYPEIVYPVDSNDDKVEKFLLTKARFWEYEQERRVIERAGPGTYSLPPELLTGVILGCRMRETDRAQVREWSLQRKPKSQLYEARPLATQFGLDIVPVE